jgi:hypothetical protein
VTARTRTRLLVGAAIVCAVAAGLLLWPGTRPPSNGGTPSGPEEVAQTPARVPTQQADDADLSIQSGATLALDAASLPQDGPLVLDLVLGEPDRSEEPSPVRLVAPDGRVLHTQARIGGEDWLEARIEVDPEWLTPGRYIIEIKTRERTHLPLRRYALEIR